MLSDDDRLAGRLLDIVRNIDKSRDFCAGYDYARFQADDRTYYAVVRALEIISEACRHVPAAIMERHGHIAWHRIKAAGNIYRHVYKDIEPQIVWDTVQSHLAPVREAAVTEITRLGYAHLIGQD